MNVSQMIADWQAIRAELAEIEASEHLDITDQHGRVWVWWSGDLYRHCQMAWPESMVRAEHGLPTDSVKSNPNYQLCTICQG